MYISQSAGNAQISELAAAQCLTTGRRPRRDRKKAPGDFPACNVRDELTPGVVD